MIKIPQHKYHTLDGIRGVAAILIVLRHTADYFGTISFAESYLAVDLFFALSGFVIADAYDKRLATGLTRIEFMQIRVIRLYPLYLLGTFLGFLFYLKSVFWGHNDMSIDFVVISALAVFMLPSPVTSSLYPLNGPTWSLFFELLSNCLYAIFHPKLTKKSLVVVIALSAVVLAISANKMGHLDAGSQWQYFYVGLARVFLSFSFGLLIHRCKDNRIKFNIPSFVLVLLSIVFLCYEPQSTYRGLYGFITIVIVFPTIIYFSSSAEPKSVFLVKLYSTLGAVSYAVYVLHVPLSMFIRSGFKASLKINIVNFAPLSGWLLLIILVLLSIWINSKFDIPIRAKMLERLKLSKLVKKNKGL